MYWLERKYANLLQNQLNLFKLVRNEPYTAMFRCPVCGDSKKNSFKRRCYFYTKERLGLEKKVSVYCHNCGFSTTFEKFLKNTDNILYQQFKMEKMQDHQPVTNKVENKVEKEEFKENDERLLDALLDRLDSLDDEHPAVLYCLERKIPRKHFKKIYFIDNVSNIEQLSEKYKNKIKGKEPRIIFPFFSRQHKLVGVQCRAIDDNKIRYISIHLNEQYPMIFNLDAVDLKKMVYVFEGPIDSLFVDNSVAVGTSDLRKVIQTIPKRIMVLDNQPRNKEILSMYNKLIENGEIVCMWPKSIEEKDINDMVLAGHDVKKLIDENLYQGMKAKLKFAEWRRFDD